MGIQGLHSHLKSISNDKHVREFRGKRMGIDMYVWLHNSISSCAELLAHNKPTDRYVNYVEKNMRSLMKHDITPVAVFDGDALPAKKGENESRRESRNRAREKALNAEAAGDFNLARQYWVSALGVSSEMVKNTIARLKQMGIEVVVAPYEADAQLAYMQRNGYLDAVISVDGDLLAFGCTCLFAKYDYRSGMGKEICVFRDMKKVQGYNFSDWSPEMFQLWCVLIGCDYVSNIPKCGPKKCYELVKNHGMDLANIIKKIKMQGYDVAKDYLKRVKIALFCFNHMTVFDPIKRSLEPLMDFPDDPQVTEGEIKLLDTTVEELSEQQRLHCGDYYDDATARDVADGILCPKDKTPRAEQAVPEKSNSVAARAKANNPFFSALDAYAKKPPRVGMPRQNSTDVTQPSQSSQESGGMFPTLKAAAPAQSAESEPFSFGDFAYKGNNSNKENSRNAIPENNPVPDGWKPSSGPVSASNFYGSNDQKKTVTQSHSLKRKSAPLQESDTLNRQQPPPAFGQAAQVQAFGQASQSQSQSQGSRGSSAKRFKSGHRDANQPTIMEMFSRQKAKSNPGDESEQLPSSWAEETNQQEFTWQGNPDVVQNTKTVLTMQEFSDGVTLQSDGKNNTTNTEKPKLALTLDNLNKLQEYEHASGKIPTSHDPNIFTKHYKVYVNPTQHPQKPKAPTPQQQRQPQAQPQTFNLVPSQEITTEFKITQEHELMPSMSDELISPTKMYPSPPDNQPQDSPLQKTTPEFGDSGKGAPEKKRKSVQPTATIPMRPVMQVPEFRPKPIVIPPGIFTMDPDGFAIPQPRKKKKSPAPSPEPLKLDTIEHQSSQTWEKNITPALLTKAANKFSAQKAAAPRNDRSLDEMQSQIVPQSVDIPSPSPPVVLDPTPESPVLTKKEKRAREELELQRKYANNGHAFQSVAFCPESYAERKQAERQRKKAAGIEDDSSSCDEQYLTDIQPVTVNVPISQDPQDDPTNFVKPPPKPGPEKEEDLRVIAQKAEKELSDEFTKNDILKDQFQTSIRLFDEQRARMVKEYEQQQKDTIDKTKQLQETLRDCDEKLTRYRVYKKYAAEEMEKKIARDKKRQQLAQEELHLKLMLDKIAKKQKLLKKAENKFDQWSSTVVNNQPIKTIKKQKSDPKPVVQKKVVKKKIEVNLKKPKPYEIEINTFAAPKTTTPPLEEILKKHTVAAPPSKSSNMSPVIETVYTPSPSPVNKQLHNITQDTSQESQIVPTPTGNTSIPPTVPDVFSASQMVATQLPVGTQGHEWEMQINRFPRPQVVAAKTPSSNAGRRSRSNSGPRPTA